VFQGGDRICLLPWGLFSWGEETHVLSKDNLLCYKQGDLEHCFHVRIEFVFHLILPVTYVFQGGNRCFSSKSAYFVKLKNKSHILLKINPFLLEAWVSKTVSLLDLSEFLKGMLPANHSFKVDKGSFNCKWCIQLSWRNACISPKETMYGRACSILHIVSLQELR
jgi:hypothetical protein